MQRLAVAEAGPQDRLPLLLERALPALRRNVVVVLVSTRHVDPAEATGHAVRASSGRAPWEWSGRIECIDVSSDELPTYFLAQ
jgi:hypothetical protein